MDPKQQQQYERQLELASKVQSIMAHPEWGTIVGLIEDERRFHTNKSRSIDFRQDPSQYGNIVRAMDAADAVQGILNKFDTIIALGAKAKQELDVTNGIIPPKPR